MYEIERIIATETRTVLRCIACDNEQDLLKERVFKCNACGNILEVIHKYPRLRRRDISDMKQVFDERCAPRLGNPLTQSGIWRYKELIGPTFPPEHIVTLGEGFSPIVPAGKHMREFIGGNVDVWMIMEGENPTGAFKAYGMTVLVTCAVMAGAKFIVCSSTGDTAAALAAYAAKAGIPCAVLMEQGGVTKVQGVHPPAHGAQTIMVPSKFDGIMRIVTELYERGGYPGNSKHPMRIEGHQATMFQIAHARNWTLPDWVVGPVGNGSNLSSIDKGQECLLALGFVDKRARILGCQAAGADPLSRSYFEAEKQSGDLLCAWRHLYQPVPALEDFATAMNIGDPVSREKVMRGVCRSGGAMETAGKSEAHSAMLACAKDGYFACPQTGVAVDGVRRAVEKGVIKDGESVYIVSTATGLKFSEQFEPHVRGSIRVAPDANVETIAHMLNL